MLKTNKTMKKNLPLTLVVIGATINVLSFDFDNFNFENIKTWLFLISLAIIIKSIVLMIVNNQKKNKVNLEEQK